MKCSKGAVELVDQIIGTIDLIGPEDYQRPLDVYNGSTLGKHFRHIYEFFYCIAEESSMGVIDYCMRARDHDLECDKFCAIERFNLLKKALLSIDEDRMVTVHADFELANGNRPRVKSTLGREIMYAYDHAVHHLAIVKIGVKTIDPNIAIDQELGVAASTIRHQHSLNNA